MKGKRFVLGLGILLVLISYPIAWYSSGGTGTPLSLDDPKVLKVLELLSESRYHYLLATGVPQRAWESTSGESSKANVIIALNGFPWRASLEYSAEGVPLNSFQEINDPNVAMAAGILVPVYLRRVGYAMLVIWLLGGILIPRIFGRKCGHCPNSFWRPAFLDITETTQYPGGFDVNGDYLDPIIKREMKCPRCGYTYTEYFIGPGARAGKIWRSVFTTRGIPWRFDEQLQRVTDKWFEENANRTRFKSYDEWKAYWNELKASEGARL